MRRKTKHLLIGCGALILTLGAVGGIIHLTTRTNVVDKLVNPRKGEVVATIENIIEDEEGKEKKVPLLSLDGETGAEDEFIVKGLDRTTFSVFGCKESITINPYGEFAEKSYVGMKKSVSEKEKHNIWGNITATGDMEDTAYGSSVGLELPHFVTKVDLPKDEETFDVVAEMSYFDTIRINYSINHSSYIEYGALNDEDSTYESAQSDYKYLNKDKNLFIDYDIMSDGHFYYNELGLQVFGLGGIRDIDVEIDSIELVRKNKDKANAHLYLIEEIVTGGGQSMDEGSNN